LSDFFQFFLGAGGAWFLLGFLRKSGAERGVFVVSLWWNAWQTWRVDGQIFG
jgi:hypothetical protein